MSEAATAGSTHLRLAHVLTADEWERYADESHDWALGGGVGLAPEQREPWMGIASTRTQLEALVRQGRLGKLWAWCLGWSPWR